MERAWADDLAVLRAVAANRIRAEWLQRWWCKKYNRPRKDPLLSEYTLEELMIEYLEDLIEEDPQQEFPEDVQRAGNYVRRTGDTLLDKWQEKAATGEKIDFEEAFDDESLKQFEAIKKASKERHGKKPPVPVLDELPDEIHDDYSDGGK